MEIMEGVSMKALVCEMCGSPNLVKQKGLFVCQNCGTKYSVEEARKMMIDGVVNVKGTVKISSDDKIKNLYTLARRAREEDNTLNAAQYYREILLERPNDWEAQYYSVYCEAFSCKLGEIGNAAYTVSNSIPSIFNSIKKYVPNASRSAIFEEIKIHTLILGSALYTSAVQHAAEYASTDLQKEVFAEVKQMVKNILGMYSTLALELESAGYPQSATDLYEQCIERSDLRGITIYSTNEKKTLFNKIRLYNPNYSYKFQYQGKKSPQSNSGSNSGCFVATAVYGSYDCPEVWTLRRYRDYTLSKHWLGRAFIYAYYTISPTLVNCFGHTIWFKNISRRPLDKIVHILQKKGYSSKPYKDYI